MGESFRFQSLADFKGVQHRDVVKKTRESNESLAVKLLTQNEEIGFAGGCNSEGNEKLGATIEAIRSDVNVSSRAVFVLEGDSSSPSFSMVCLYLG